MNDRRILLTKDEVKLLGTELTANTTDDIAALYLPIDNVDSYYHILFDYRTLDHNDYSYSYIKSNYKIYINTSLVEPVKQFVPDLSNNYAT